jgi:hypothetical protein
MFGPCAHASIHTVQLEAKLAKVKPRLAKLGLLFTVVVGFSWRQNPTTTTTFKNTTTAKARVTIPLRGCAMSVLWSLISVLSFRWKMIEKEETVFISQVLPVFQQLMGLQTNASMHSHEVCSCKYPSVVS